MGPRGTKLSFSLGFSRVGAKKYEKPMVFYHLGPQPGLPEPKWRGCLEWNRGSGILFSDPPDPLYPLYPADPAEMVSGAAVQTLPNHAQESQDDVSSQANSLKLNVLVTATEGK